MTYEDAVIAYESAILNQDISLVIQSMEQLHMLGRGAHRNPALTPLVDRIRSLESARVTLLGKPFQMPNVTYPVDNKLPGVRVAS